MRILLTLCLSEKGYVYKKRKSTYTSSSEYVQNPFKQALDCEITGKKLKLVWLEPSTGQERGRVLTSLLFQ